MSDNFIIWTFCYSYIDMQFCEWIIFSTTTSLIYQANCKIGCDMGSILAKCSHNLFCLIFFSFPRSILFIISIHLKCKFMCLKQENSCLHDMWSFFCFKKLKTHIFLRTISKIYNITSESNHVNFYTCEKKIFKRY